MIKRPFFQQFFEQVKKDPLLDWAATLAYYFMLSIFPLMIFMLALLPYFPLNPGQLYEFVNDYIPGELGELFTATVLEVVTEPQGGLLSIGILATVWSASNGVNALIRSINRAYNIEETRHFFQLRILSIVMTLGMIIVIVATLLMPVFGHVIIETLETFFLLPSDTASFLQILRWVIGIGLMTIVLMVLYALAPNVHLRLRDVMVGAIFATTGWQLISYGFSVYISNFGNYTATYGSLGGVIILMLWFFLSGLILVLGGEVNATLYRLHLKSQPIKK
ncbi:YihY/virulence factor BrkB family protein [Halalkalibacterium ligniniphilum]|uniref:YihY/virulence factor BrkB family protein n=1 Tax=Halalkalibacterium ligniniphilum TaxID=1134413 RepID=UPI00037590C2|nr:YihY/virulence factor BrkB family protein [Halalkalibacterium ligniniphilum]